MFNLFWGVVLLLHPFILRLSAFRTQISGSAGKGDFSEWFKSNAMTVEVFDVSRMGQNTFFIMAVVLSSLLFKGKDKLPKFELCAFSSLIVLSFFNQYDFLSPNVLYQNMLFLFGILFLKNIYENYTEKTEKHLYKILGISCLLHCGWVFLEYFGVNLHHVYVELVGGKLIRSSGEMKGVLNNSNMSGAYIAFTAPILFKLKKILLIIPIIALGVLGAVMPPLTLSSVFLYWLWAENLNYKTVPFLGAMTILGLASFLLFSPNAKGIDSGRFLVWSVMFKKLDSFTIFGNGLGYISDVFPRVFHKFSTVFRHAHNELISVYFSHGLVGLGVVLATLKRAVTATTPFKSALIFGIFINSLGNFPFHVSSLFVVCGFFIVGALKEVEYV